MQAFRDAGTMRPTWLPHYFADLELAVRVRKAGYRLLVSEQAAVFSADKYGSTWRPGGLMNRFFMVRSSSYLPALLAFWWSASSFRERLSLLPRLVRKFAHVTFHRIPDFPRSSQ
jgi:GT2 family glycosyltransferase